MVVVAVGGQNMAGRIWGHFGGLAPQNFAKLSPYGKMLHTF